MEEFGESQYLDVLKKSTQHQPAAKAATRSLANRCVQLKNEILESQNIPKHC